MTNELRQFITIFGPTNIVFVSISASLLVIVRGFSFNEIWNLESALNGVIEEGETALRKLEMMAQGRASYIFPFMVLFCYIAYRVFWWFPSYQQWVQRGAHPLNGAPLGLPFNIFTGVLWGITYFLFALQLWVCFCSSYFIHVCSKKNLNLNLLHPDRAGGTKPLGHLALVTALGLSVGGIMMPVAYAMTTIIGFVSELMVAGYSAAILFSFFIPIYNLHSAIARAKTNGVLKLANHVFSTLEDARREYRTGKLQRLAVLFTMYDALLDKAQRTKEWPLDSAILSKLTLYVLLPVLTYLTQAALTRYLGLIGVGSQLNLTP
jgi:hypothetical protein